MWGTFVYSVTILCGIVSSMRNLWGVFIVGYIFLYILEFSSVREINISEKLTNKKFIGVYLGY
jgi:uncharacterized membrane protein